MKRSRAGCAFRFAASPPARGRGLKQVDLATTRSSPKVAPCAGAWIETDACRSLPLPYLGRPLRGGVD